MITYEPFWKTLKEKNISTYKLIKEYHISSGTIHKLRHNLGGITTLLLNDLCNILACDITDIIKYTPNENPYRKKEERDFDF